jgi:hypothetical protein
MVNAGDGIGLVSGGVEWEGGEKLMKGRKRFIAVVCSEVRGRLVVVVEIMTLLVAGPEVVGLSKMAFCRLFFSA